MIAAFILMKQNRMGIVADRRDHLDLQVNLLTERRATRIIRMLELLSVYLGVEQHRDPESSELAQQVPSRFVLEFDWRGLRSDEDTWSGSKVNRLIGEFLDQALPSIHFAHSDLT